MLLEIVWSERRGEVLPTANKLSFISHSLQAGTNPVHALVEIQVVGHRGDEPSLVHEGVFSSTPGDCQRLL